MELRHCGRCRTTAFEAAWETAPGDHLKNVTASAAPATRRDRADVAPVPLHPSLGTRRSGLDMDLRDMEILAQGRLQLGDHVGDRLRRRENPGGFRRGAAGGGSVLGEPVAKFLDDVAAQGEIGLAAQGDERGDAAIVVHVCEDRRRGGSGMVHFGHAPLRQALGERARSWARWSRRQRASKNFSKNGGRKGIRTLNDRPTALGKQAPCRIVRARPDPVPSKPRKQVLTVVGFLCNAHRRSQVSAPCYGYAFMF